MHSRTIYNIVIVFEIQLDKIKQCLQPLRCELDFKTLVTSRTWLFIYRFLSLYKHYKLQIIGYTWPEVYEREAD